MSGRTLGRRALVVGLGIAGMSAAIGLREAGWVPVIVERALERRMGGYFVGLFPDGKKAAKELAALRYLHTRNPVEGTDWQIDARGRHKASFGFLDQPGEPYAVMRGDIEAALWERIQGVGATDFRQAPVEVRFGTRPVSIVEEPGVAAVTLESIEKGEKVVEKFELVVGSDGMRSTVRELVFGAHEQFMKPWNAIICAFELEEQVPGYKPQDGITLALPKRAAWVFPFSDRTPTALLTYRTKEIDAQFARSPIDSLKKAYAGVTHHPVVSHSLEAMQTAPHYLFDSVHSVHMSRWHQGRIVLLGDSAWCLTLYSGMGSTSALRGGAVLAESLMAYPDDLEAALNDWEGKMRPFITSNQRRARIIQHMFVPTGHISSALRNAALSLVGLALRSKKRKKNEAPGVAREDLERAEAVSGSGSY